VQFFSGAHAAFAETVLDNDESGGVDAGPDRQS